MCHEVNILNGLHFEIPHAKLYLHVLMRYLDFFVYCLGDNVDATREEVNLLKWMIGGPYSSVLNCQGGILQDKNMKFDVIFHYEIEGNNKENIFFINYSRRNTYLLILYPLPTSRH